MSLLCTSCSHKPHCLPAQLAAKDSTLNAMLGQLHSCTVKAHAPQRSRRRPSPFHQLGQWLWQVGQQLWQWGRG